MIMHLCAIPRDIAIDRGLKTYVDPRACKRGHFAHKGVNDRTCSVCRRESKKKHMRRKNADSRYRQEHNRKRREKYHADADYRRSILDKCREQYQRNPEPAKKRSTYRKEYAFRYYRENRERIIEYQRQYRARNKEKVRSWQSKCKRSRRSAKPIWFSEYDSFVIDEAQALCLERERATGIKWEVDHSIPLSSGIACGLHCADNLQVIPAHLNRYKNRKMLYTEDLEWLQDMRQ